jgi:hypothetical protein
MGLLEHWPLVQPLLLLKLVESFFGLKDFSAKVMGVSQTNMKERKSV